ncbi:metal ABC transporter permease [Limibaculum sp. M0105]|uniref:Metal ABC transporter permease n=1 Tax=Thermohalobaculum xanthum TaxID=2753746 RepID=A0A8J7M8W9_9RHOB|nr:metal ABC transporter permease [Thermohalobaculum xanthum]MBK0400298.1 metal ABC transporter permease [Thermohalobaculum xanthum]
MQALFDDPGFSIMATGFLVGAAAAMLGPFLILRRAAMLSDAISHSIVLGIVAVWLLTGAVSGPLQILGAALTGVLTVVLTEMIAATGRVKSDAAIGLVFPALFAAGVLLLNLYASDVHIDTHTVLLGEIGFVWLDTLEVAGLSVPRALVWMGAAAAADLAFITLFWKELKIGTFDPVLAHAMGLAPRALFYVLLFLTSGTAVAAFDAVGAILFIAFIVMPPATAYLLTDRLERMVPIGVAVAGIASLGGYGLALQWDVSISGMMAVVTGACLGLAVLAAPRHGVVAAMLRRARSRRENETRALVVHLATHEDTAARREENVAAALRLHLDWPDRRAREVLVKGVAAGLVRREGEALLLTDEGRRAAEALLEPWRRGGG